MEKMNNNDSAKYHKYSKEELINKLVNLEKKLLVKENNSKEEESDNLSEHLLIAKYKISLKESEERFRLLSETAIEGIVFLENDLIIDVNERFVFMLGYSQRNELIGKNINDFILIKTYKSIINKISPKTNRIGEVKIKKIDSSLLSVEIREKEIPYHGKKIRAIILHNISQRKKHLNALKESERILSTLMNSLPGMAYRCVNKSESLFQFISEGCYLLTGYKSTEFLNKNTNLFNKLVHNEDKTAVFSLFNNALEQKIPFELEYRIIDKLGKEKWVWEKGAGVYDENGVLEFVEGFISDITIQKEYNRLITQSHESYRNLVEHSTVGVILFEDDNVVYSNILALGTFGFDNLEELNSTTFWNCISPEYKKLLKENIDRIKKGQELPFHEIKIQKNTGEYISIEINGSIIDFYGKKTLQIICYDISYRKALQKEQLRAQIAEETNKKFQIEISNRIKAQTELVEVQKFTRSIIKSSLDMICATDKQNNIIEFNEAAQKKFGYSIKELKNKHPKILYYNENEYLLIDKILNKKGSFSGEVINRCKNGEKFISFLSASILKNEEGKVIGSMGVSRDITDEKNIKQKLYEQASKIKSFFDSSSHMFWTVNMDMDLTSFNQKYAEICYDIYGITPVIAEPLPTFGNYLLDEQSHLFWKNKYLKVREGKPQKFEVEQKKRDGGFIVREVFLNPIYDVNGNIVEIAAISGDITERKNDQKKIKESLQEKEVLLKEIHHRVKNNLQVISSILNLQSSFVKDENTLIILRESQNRIKAMAFIHESLYQTKDFSKIGFSEYILNLSKNLVHSYGQINNLIDLSIKADEVYLNLDLAIPAGLIINELVSNALKYAFPDNRKGNINICIIEKDGVVDLIVTDDGVGLPDGIDIYNTETLGLQLVTALCEQIHGKIELTTKQNQGTQYKMVFNKQLIK